MVLVMVMWCWWKRKRGRALYNVQCAYAVSHFDAVRWFDGKCSVAFQLVNREVWLFKRFDYTNETIRFDGEGQSKHIQRKTNHVLKIKRYGWCVFNRLACGSNLLCMHSSNHRMDGDSANVARTLQSIPFYFHTLKRYVCVSVILKGIGIEELEPLLSQHIYWHSAEHQWIKLQLSFAHQSPCTAVSGQTHVVRTASNTPLCLSLVMENVSVYVNFRHKFGVIGAFTQFHTKSSLFVSLLCGKQMNIRTHNVACVYDSITRKLSSFFRC